jgi:mannose-1-phosphate guanylyltransferase
MKALVLIGGFGTRLRPVTYGIPKQLIPLAGKPMLYHVLDLLPPEVDEAVFATGYKSEVIQQYVVDHPPKLRVTCVVETTPLGTGGGMRNAGDDISDPFILLNSDVIAQVDVPALLGFHRRHGGVGTMTLAAVEDTRPYGVAALEKDDRITRFVEKPAPEDAPSHWINAGVQVWNRSVMERIPRGRPVSFETEIVPLLLPERIYGFRSEGFWEDAGTPPRLLRAQQLLFDAGRGGDRPRPSGVLGRGPVFVSGTASADGATVGPYVHLDDGVVIAPGARVENSVLMAGVSVGRGATVTGSILGPGVQVAPGARVDQAVLGNAPPD